MKDGENFWEYKLREWMRDLTSLANPIILLFVPLCFLGWNSTYFFLLALLAVNEVLGSLIKLFFHKPRPTGQKFNNALEKIDAGSFPSLHSSRIAVVYLTLTFAATQVGFQVLFISLILVVGVSRVFLRKHFVADVVGGYCFGGFLFALAHYLF